MQSLLFSVCNFSIRRPQQSAFEHTANSERAHSYLPITQICIKCFVNFVVVLADDVSTCWTHSKENLNRRAQHRFESRTKRQREKRKIITLCSMSPFAEPFLLYFMKYHCFYSLFFSLVVFHICFFKLLQEN